MSAETIQAIAGLFPLATVMLAAVALIYFRKELKHFFKEHGGISLRKGDTEFTIAPKNQKQLEQSAATGGQSSDLATNNGSSEPSLPPTKMNELRTAIVASDHELAERLFNELQLEENDEQAKIDNRGWYYFLMFRDGGDADALAKLEKLAKQPNVGLMIYYWLALCYDTIDDSARAAATLDGALDKCPTPEERARFTSMVIERLFQDGREEEAFARAFSELGRAQSVDAASILYEGLSELYKLKNDKQLRAIALDKSLQHRPNNQSLRLGAAFDYGHAGFPALSYLHYCIILKFNADLDSALNNAGVAAKSLGLGIKAVEYYKGAAALNLTLAMSNLATLYLDAGFSQEASELVERARKLDSVNPNVGQLLATIPQKLSEEQENERKFVADAREQQKFMSLLSEALFVVQPNQQTSISFAGQWKSQAGQTFEVVEASGHVTTTWKDGLVTFNLNCKILNRGARGNAYSTKDNIFSRENYSALAFMSADLQEFRVLLVSKDKHLSTAYLFRRFG